MSRHYNHYHFYKAHAVPNWELFAATREETVTIADPTITAKITAIVKSEAVTIVDSITKALSGRIFSEIITIVDTRTVVVTFTKTLTETITILRKAIFLLNGNLIKNIWAFTSKNEANTWSMVSKNESNNWTIKQKSGIGGTFH